MSLEYDIRHPAKVLADNSAEQSNWLKQEREHMCPESANNPTIYCMEVHDREQLANRPSTPTSSTLASFMSYSVQLLANL